MASETIRYGIIGTGMMGCEHIRNLREVPGVEISALADTGDRGKVEAFLPAHRLVRTRRDRDEPATVEFEVDPRAKRLGAHHGSTFLEHLAFRDAIRSGGRPIVSAADGALAVAVGAAGERSVRERRPVELRELGI